MRTRKGGKKPPPTHFFYGLELRFASEPKKLVGLTPSSNSFRLLPSPTYSNPKNEMAGKSLTAERKVIFQDLTPFSLGIGSTKLDNPLGTNSIIEIISNVLDWLIIYSIPILALMILIGGFQILTARDKPEQITSGRKTIQWAVVGFVIILISKGIALILLNIIG